MFSQKFQVICLLSVDQLHSQFNLFFLSTRAEEKHLSVILCWLHLLENILPSGSSNLILVWLKQMVGYASYVKNKQTNKQKAGVDGLFCWFNFRDTHWNTGLILDGCRIIRLLFDTRSDSWRLQDNRFLLVRFCLHLQDGSDRKTLLQRIPAFLTSLASDIIKFCQGSPSMQEKCGCRNVYFAKISRPLCGHFICASWSSKSVFLLCF